MSNAAGALVISAAGAHVINAAGALGSDQATLTAASALRNYTTDWILESDCAYLDGHFPNQPLMPAVAIIDGSIELLRQALHLPDLQPRSIFNAKFMAPITPGLKIKISLVELSEMKWQVEWASLTPLGATQSLARVGLHI